MPSESYQATFGSGGLNQPRRWPDVDGAEKLDREPTSAEIRWGITADELDRRQKASPKATKDCERHCPECGQRVTETTEGREAGHAEGRKAPRCRYYDSAVGVESISDY